MSPLEQAKISYLILHRSPVFVLLDLLLIECVYFIFIALLLWFLLVLLNQITLSPLGLIAILFVSLVLKAGAVALAGVGWLHEYYEIRVAEITHHRGIFRKYHEVLSTGEVRSITLTQDFLGQILRYGTLTLHNPALGQEIRLAGISNPNRCQQLLAQFLPKIEQPPSFIQTGGIAAS
ncbi:PH domain-containing protein [Candidatus Berkelbacteria bacterium]|nr:PH domain-containing protein [Candidatus Berkelbacteria bacterium]